MRPVVLGLVAIGIIAFAAYAANSLYDQSQSEERAFEAGQRIAASILNATPTPDSPLTPALEYKFSCTTDSSVGFAYVRGVVYNISTDRLDNVAAEAVWFASDGETFIRADDALIDFDPLLPGQTSPFEVMSRYNPAMAKCAVQFKELGGAEIPSRRLPQ